MTKIFFHITVIQCPAIASLHGYNLYIYIIQMGEKKKRVMHDSFFVFFLKERQRRNKDTKNKNKKTASNKRYSAPNNILRRTVTHLSFIIIKGIFFTAPIFCTRWEHRALYND